MLNSMHIIPHFLQNASALSLCYGFSEIAALLTNLSQVFCPSSEECVATSARCHFANGDIVGSLCVRRNTLPTAFSCGAHHVGTKAEEGFFPFRWQARRARAVRCKRVVRHRQPLLFAKRRHTACSTSFANAPDLLAVRTNAGC